MKEPTADIPSLYSSLSIAIPHSLSLDLCLSESHRRIIDLDNHHDTTTEYNRQIMSLPFLSSPLVDKPKEEAAPPEEERSQSTILRPLNTRLARAREFLAG
jgi:hypothetical protein